MRLTAGVFVIVSSLIGLSARDARGETFEWLSVTVAPGSTPQTLSARAALRFRGPRNGTTERWTWDVDGPPVQFTARTRFDEPLLTRWDSSHDPPEITFDMSPPVITTDRATGQPLERRHAEISLEIPVQTRHRLLFDTATLRWMDFYQLPIERIELRATNGVRFVSSECSNEGQGQLCRPTEWKSPVVRIPRSGVARDLALIALSIASIAALVAARTRAKIRALPVQQPTDTTPAPAPTPATATTTPPQFDADGFESSQNYRDIPKETPAPEPPPPPPPPKPAPSVDPEQRKALVRKGAVSTALCLAPLATTLAAIEAFGTKEALPASIIAAAVTGLFFAWREGREYERLVASHRKGVYFGERIRAQPLWRKVPAPSIVLAVIAVLGWLGITEFALILFFLALIELVAPKNERERTR